MVFSIDDVTPQMLPTSTEYVPQEPNKSYVFCLQENEFLNDIVEHLYGPFDHVSHVTYRSAGNTSPHLSANSTMNRHHYLRNEAEVSQIKQSQSVELKRYIARKDDRAFRAKKILNELIAKAHGSARRDRGRRYINSTPYLPKPPMPSRTLHYYFPTTRQDHSITIHNYKHTANIYNSTKSTKFSPIIPAHRNPIIPIFNSPSSSRALPTDILPIVSQRKPKLSPIINIDDSDDDMELSNDGQLSKPATPIITIDGSDDNKEISDDDDNLLEMYTDTEEIEIYSKEAPEDGLMENVHTDDESVINNPESPDYYSAEEDSWETDSEEEISEEDLTKQEKLFEKELAALRTVLQQIKEHIRSLRNDCDDIYNYFKTTRKGSKYVFIGNQFKPFLNSINQSSSKLYKAAKKAHTKSTRK